MTDREDDSRETYEITCSKCGEDASIPFEPDRDEAVYCRDCFEETKRRRQREREEASPRKQHDTRVSFRITCAECGEEAELDYVPRGVSMDEVRCEECFADEAEGSRWEDVQQRKKDEQAYEWAFECDECGRTDYLNFKPKPDKDYLCTTCFYDHAEPDDDRLEEKEAVGRGVYIRKSDDS